MQLRLKNRAQEALSLNLTPLIDIIFLLLLFFMVSTTFKQPRALNIELPEVSADATKYTSSEKRIIEIGINQRGEYFLQQKPLNTKDEKLLKKILSTLVRPRACQNSIENSIENPMENSIEIIIMGDKLAPHQSVVSAMDIVAQLGIKQLRIKAASEHI